MQDVLGHRQLADIKENGMSAHAKYGTWVLDELTPAIYHLSGRRALAISSSMVSGSQITEDNGASSGPVLDAGSLAGSNSGTQSFVAKVDGLQRPGLVAPSQQGGSGPESQKPTYNFRGLCFHCNLKGHSFKFCPSKHGSDR